MNKSTGITGEKVNRISKENERKNHELEMKKNKDFKSKKSFKSYVMPHNITGFLNLKKKWLWERETEREEEKAEHLLLTNAMDLTRDFE